MSELPVSEARTHLPQLLDRVERGEEVTLTRHGRAVAVVVRPDLLRTRRAGSALADAQRVAGVVRAGHSRRIAVDEGMDAARAEELVAEIRADRDAG
ncbi:MAG: type II toxin-antitoxin system prevent-host-death family antitoxin [Pseudonocardiaceae bacterium]|nr:type II toxin-antitoxin system prevent-host-death family antitoxin [Pseudonocardiaceae bacterium]